MGAEAYHICVTVALGYAQANMLASVYPDRLVRRLDLTDAAMEDSRAFSPYSGTAATCQAGSWRARTKLEYAELPRVRLDPDSPGPTG